MTRCVPKLEKQFLVRSFYCFQALTLPIVEVLQRSYQDRGLALDLSGTVLLSSEGCNGAIAGSAEAVSKFSSRLAEDFPKLHSQDTYSEFQPFNRWKVPIKDQIVKAGDQRLNPAANFGDQKSAEEWDDIRQLAEAGKVQMIDVRNNFEIGIGSFPEAIDPQTNTFKEFSDFLDREVGRSLTPDLPTAIFCTGGIRCEKARVDLENRGFQTVWQLKGGIIGYLRESKNSKFQGECFVFDDRIALDQTLKPTETYDLCPQCGGPRAKDEGDHECASGRVVR